MKVTKVECPNCHGSLNIPDGMKEGFVSCEFCNTKVYIEPHKPDITQNFNIGSVNYNKANSVSDTDSLIDLKTWVSIGGSVLGALTIIVLLLLNGKSSDKREAINTANYRSTPKDAVVMQFVEEAFGKPLEEISKEDYDSIQSLNIQKYTEESSSDHTKSWRFSYAEKLDENGNPVDEESLYFPLTDSISEQDMQVFTGLVRLSLGTDISFDYEAEESSDLKNLENLKYFSAEDESLNDTVKILGKPEEILSLSGLLLFDNEVPSGVQDKNGKEIKDIFTPFSSLKSLSISIDGDYESGLFFLRNLPTLEKLEISLSASDTALDLSPLSSLSQCTSLSIVCTSDTSFENVSVFSGMPKLEHIRLDSLSDIKDLNFVKNMPNLKSLYLKDLPILNLDGLSNRKSLNSLTIESCYDLENVDALLSLSSLQRLSIQGVSCPSPDLQGLSALEDVQISE